MPKELALEQRFRERRTVNHHQRSIGLWAGIVDRLCHELLPGTTFPFNQYRLVAGRNPFDQPQDFADRRRGTENLPRRSLPLQDFAEPRVFSLQTPGPRRLANDRFQIREPYRFAHIVDRSRFHRGDCRVDRRPSGEHHDLQMIPLDPQPLEQLDPIHLRHVDVDHRHIELPLAKRLERCTPRRDRSHMVTPTTKILRRRLAKISLIVDQEELNPRTHVRVSRVSRLRRFCRCALQFNNARKKTAFSLGIPAIANAKLAPNHLRFAVNLDASSRGVKILKAKKQSSIRILSSGVCSIARLVSEWRTFEELGLGSASIFAGELDLWIGEGDQGKHEDCQHPWSGTSELQASSMPCGQPPSDREAESGAAWSGGKKGFEDPRQVGGWNSSAIVPNLNPHGGHRLDPSGGDLDVDRSFRVARFDPIFKKVAEDLLERERVGQDCGRGMFSVPAKVDLFFGDKGPEVLPGLAEDRIELDLLQFEPYGAGKLKDFFIEVQEVVMGALDAFDQLDRHRPILELQQKRFERRLAPRERIAALMRQPRHRLTDRSEAGMANKLSLDFFEVRDVLADAEDPRVCGGSERFVARGVARRGKGRRRWRLILPRQPADSSWRTTGW